MQMPINPTQFKVPTRTYAVPPRNLQSLLEQGPQPSPFEDATVDLSTAAQRLLAAPLSEADILDKARNLRRGGIALLSRGTGTYPLAGGRTAKVSLDQGLDVVGQVKITNPDGTNTKVKVDHGEVKVVLKDGTKVKFPAGKKPRVKRPD
ncbi:MAG: hypothetical protein KC910_21700 [Candidatus Eremiobacteraeota bacterium]|nr:hypothetical protein [Candidatus Eremiobacteraeota bacterium]